MNYSAPRVKAIPMTKLHSSYNFPWLSNFNYNSVSLQLLSLNFYSFSNWAHKKFFLPPNRSSLLASSRSDLFSYAMFCVNSLFYLFIYFFLYLFICFNFSLDDENAQGNGRNIQIFFFLGFDILFYSIWIAPLIPTVIVKIQINFCNGLMLVK